MGYHVGKEKCNLQFIVSFWFSLKAVHIEGQYKQNSRSYIFLFIQKCMCVLQLILGYT